MISESIMQELHYVLKRSELIKMLAEAEIKTRHIFSDAEFQRAERECNVKSISRQDIDFKKACILDPVLSEIKEERERILDSFKTDTENREAYKGILLELIDRQDKRYKELQAEFNYQF
jgi:hypothetical protein